jgi:DNA-binding NarL/FixJ family response regulator
MSRPRVLLADDHRMVTEGLRRVLETEFKVVGIVENGRELLHFKDKLKPDVIVVDISMPLLNGIDAIRQIKLTNKDVKVVFLTMHPDVAYAASALEAGAHGYVLKNSAPSELVTAIKHALRGETYITSSIESRLRTFYKERKVGRDILTGLTLRQREVLQLIAEGRTAKEIADVLNISLRTVEYHKYRLLKDIGIKSVADLTRFAVKHGIIHT